ncbi:unnamed protein product [Ectocarpus fasciculatus]
MLDNVSCSLTAKHGIHTPHPSEGLRKLWPSAQCTYSWYSPLYPPRSPTYSTPISCCRTHVHSSIHGDQILNACTPSLASSPPKARCRPTHPKHPSLERETETAPGVSVVHSTEHSLYLGQRVHRIPPLQIATRMVSR